MARSTQVPAEPVVFSTGTCATADADGVGYSLREGEVWAADDPLVLTHPGLFSDTPPAPNFPRRTVAIADA